MQALSSVCILNVKDQRHKTFAPLSAIKRGYMKKFSLVACLLSFLMMWSTQSMAAERGTFIVLPFAVQGSAEYAHLEKAIPQMLTSRLYWKGKVEPAGETSANQKPVSSEKAAENARISYKANYVVWGTITIVGNNYSLDVRMRNKAGKTWSQAREGNINQIIGSVTSISNAFNTEVFGHTSQSSSSAVKPVERVNQMNADIVINEDKPKDVYLNPQFRYSGSSAEDDSKIRSQTLPFESIGMEVCDADGDGKNEIFLLSPHKLFAYKFQGSKLNQLAELSLPVTNDPLSIRSFKRPNGKTWIIVNQVDKKTQASTIIYSFNGKAFKEEMRNIRYILNVVKVAPNYTSTLIGQQTQTQSSSVFKSGIYEMILMDGKLTTGSRLSLPETANVLNFTYIPGTIGNNGGGDKIVVLNELEKLITYTARGVRLSETEDTFSGSSAYFEGNTSMPGMGKDNVTIASKYYVPLRMLPIDLERKGTYELLVNKPISTASTLFDNYRSFPQSELQSLYWDGLGLSLRWKTRRIKGSTVDYAIADANNGVGLSMIVCLNTHPGSLGTKARKTVVMVYPLDTSRVDPNTPASVDE